MEIPIPRKASAPAIILIKRNPLDTNARHPNWNVYLDDELLVSCAYRRGARNLAMFLARAIDCEIKEISK